MISLSQEQWETINSIILSIYSENGINKLRRDFLVAIKELIPYDKSIFDLGYKKSVKVIFFDPVSCDMEQKFLESYYNDYESIDIMYWFFSQNQYDVYRESDYITSVMHNTSAFYREWLMPQNLQYSMGSRVAYDDILYGSVNLWRSTDYGDFTDEELYILTTLNKHLSLYFYKKYPNGIFKNNETDTFINRYHLTDRESEVVNLIFQGMPIKDISHHLFISENTVKKHTQNIFNKMNITNRSQLFKLVYDYKSSIVQ
jgi:DNA-binding CsgD family transcriptional regulator